MPGSHCRPMMTSVTQPGKKQSQEGEHRSGDVSASLAPAESCISDSVCIEQLRPLTNLLSPH